MGSMREIRLSERDLEIIGHLSENPRIPLTELARKMRITHTAVRKRISKLIKRGVMKYRISLNFDEMGFKIAVMLLEVDTIENLRRIARRFKGCPRLIHLFQGRGSLNLIAIMFAEDEGVLESITGTCMIRTSEGVRRSEIIEVAEPLINPFLPISIPRRSKDKASCGAICGECKRYLENSCPGCPDFEGYKLEAFTKPTRD